MARADRAAQGAALGAVLRCPAVFYLAPPIGVWGKRPGPITLARVRHRGPVVWQFFPCLPCAATEAVGEGAGA